MPGFDGTGPRGLGPKTGRGMGYCTPEILPAQVKPESATRAVPMYGAYNVERRFIGMNGFGRGGGRREGRGRNRRFY